MEYGSVDFDLSNAAASKQIIMCSKNQNATTVSRYCTRGAFAGEQVGCRVSNNVVFHRMHIITHYDVYDFFSSHRTPRYSIESLLLLLYRRTEESVCIPSFGFNTRTTTTAVSTRTRAAGQPINCTKSFRRQNCTELQSLVGGRSCAAIANKK